ncbi:MAG: hypothetical protein MOIL_01335 [Candidatus Methanolliviera sp. GoM_oil]|nr:MAG: hypothetical protein MOIL_01335 [Candidatus Methanolliviera sp. GoM_oil]
MIWERVKNTVTGKEDIPLVDDKGGYWADIVAWVIDDKGEGEVIAEYRKSLGYLDTREDKLFTISFPKNKKWREAKRPLMVYIQIIPKSGPGAPDDGTAKSLNALCCCF